MRQLATYQEAKNRLGARSTRKLGNNTYLETRDGNAIAVRLHATDVVTYYPDGRIKLRSGGWRTVTTKDRINTYSPFGIEQRNRVWTVYPEIGYQRNGQSFPFEDGLTLAPISENSTQWEHADEYERPSLTPTIDKEIPLMSFTMPRERKFRNVKEHVARGEEI